MAFLSSYDVDRRSGRLYHAVMTINVVLAKKPNTSDVYNIDLETNWLRYIVWNLMLPFVSFFSFHFKKKLPAHTSAFLTNGQVDEVCMALNR